MNDRIRTLITLAKTPELVAFYNAFGVKVITKFSDRATAEKRTAQLIEDMVAAGQFCPFCDTLNADTCGRSITWADDKEKAFRHHDCGKAFTPQGKLYGRKDPGSIAAASDRAASIAASWDDKQVAAARAQRNHVIVEGVGEFRSVKEAFIRLGLPVAKHIRFRMQLKAASTAQFASHTFKIVEAQQ